MRWMARQGALIARSRNSNNPQNGTISEAKSRCGTNYVDLFTDPVFWGSLWVTIKLNLVINPLQIALALMANQRFAGIGFYRLLFFVPIRRPLLFVLVTDTATNFLLFVPMFLLTGGGPTGSTNVLMFEAYKSGFVYGEMGRALAIVVVLLLLVVAVVALQFRLLRRSGG